MTPKCVNCGEEIDELTAMYLGGECSRCAAGVVEGGDV